MASSVIRSVACGGRLLPRFSSKWAQSSIRCTKGGKLATLLSRRHRWLQPLGQSILPSYRVEARIKRWRPSYCEAFRGLSGSTGSGVSSSDRSNHRPAVRVSQESSVNYDRDLRELNSEIAGFIGDLGDPDFDLEFEDLLPEPPRSPTHSSSSTSTVEDVEAESHRASPSTGFSLAQDVQPITPPQPAAIHEGLHVADDPYPGGPHEQGGSSLGLRSHRCGSMANEVGRLAESGRAHRRVRWLGSLSSLNQSVLVGGEDASSTALSHGTMGDSFANTRDNSKCVLLLNGAGCFIRGQLASTAEPVVSMIA